MVAFALHNSIAVLAKKNQTLEDFTYDNTEVQKVFVDQLSSLNFKGVSVSVHLFTAFQMLLINIYFRAVLLSKTGSANQTLEWNSTDVCVKGNRDVSNFSYDYH